MISWRSCDGSRVAAQLRLLAFRLRAYDVRRVDARIAKARAILAALELEASCPELGDPAHTFWLFPYQADDPQQVVERLWRCGVDTARYGSLRVVPPPDDRPELACDEARRLLDRIVFLPCYPELSDAALRRMCGVLSGMVGFSCRGA